MRSARSHVISNQNHGGMFQCMHCGETYTPALPAPVTVYSAMAKAFDKAHRDCQLGPKGRACPYCLGFGHPPDACPATKAKTPGEWLCGPDTGRSSITIWHAMMGGRRYARASRPLDPDDFGRCYRLLRLFPEWRPRMGEVAAMYPEWAPLVREWSELARMYEEESPSGEASHLYQRMKELLSEREAI